VNINNRESWGGQGDRALKPRGRCEIRPSPLKETKDFSSFFVKGSLYIKIGVCFVSFCLCLHLNRPKGYGTLLCFCFWCRTKASKQGSVVCTIVVSQIFLTNGTKAFQFKMIFCHWNLIEIYKFDLFEPRKGSSSYWLFFCLPFTFQTLITRGGRMPLEFTIEPQDFIFFNWHCPFRVSSLNTWDQWMVWFTLRSIWLFHSWNLLESHVSWSFAKVFLFFEKSYPLKQWRWIPFRPMTQLFTPRYYHNDSSSSRYREYDIVWFKIWNIFV
jgi:hypothetical protein